MQCLSRIDGFGVRLTGVRKEEVHDDLLSIGNDVRKRRRRDTRIKGRRRGGRDAKCMKRQFAVKTNTKRFSSIHLSCSFVMHTYSHIQTWKPGGGVEAKSGKIHLPHRRLLLQKWIFGHKGDTCHSLSFNRAGICMGTRMRWARK